MQRVHESDLNRWIFLELPNRCKLERLYICDRAIRAQFHLKILRNLQSVLRCSAALYIEMIVPHRRNGLVHVIRTIFDHLKYVSVTLSRRLNSLSLFNLDYKLGLVLAPLRRFIHTETAVETHTELPILSYPTKRHAIELHRLHLCG
jgi:hypothetical protein